MNANFVNGFSAEDLKWFKDLTKDTAKNKIISLSASSPAFVVDIAAKEPLTSADDISKYIEDLLAKQKKPAASDAKNAAAIYEGAKSASASLISFDPDKVRDYINKLRTNSLYPLKALPVSDGKTDSSSFTSFDPKYISGYMQRLRTNSLYPVKAPPDIYGKDRRSGTVTIINGDTAHYISIRGKGVDLYKSKKNTQITRLNDKLSKLNAATKKLSAAKLTPKAAYKAKHTIEHEMRQIKLKIGRLQTEMLSKPDLRDVSPLNDKTDEINKYIAQL